MNKTYQPKEKEIKRAWHIIDAKGQVLGRLSTKIAGLLMGKAKRPMLLTWTVAILWLSQMPKRLQ